MRVWVLHDVQSFFLSSCDCLIVAVEVASRGSSDGTEAGLQVHVPQQAFATLAFITCFCCRCLCVDYCCEDKLCLVLTGYGKYLVRCAYDEDY